MLHQHGPAELYAAWIGATQVYGRRGTLKRQAPAAHSRCTCDDVKGLEFSLRSFGKDEFVQCQIRHRLPQTLVLFLKVL